MADHSKKNPSTDEQPLGFSAEPAESPGLDRRRLLSLSLGTVAAGYMLPKVASANSAICPTTANASENVAVDLPFDDVLNFVDQRGVLKTVGCDSEYSFHGSGRLQIDANGNVRLTKLSLTGKSIAGKDKGDIQVSQKIEGAGSYGSIEKASDLIASVPVTYTDSDGSADGVAQINGFVAAGRASFTLNVDLHNHPYESEVGAIIIWSRSF